MPDDLKDLDNLKPIDHAVVAKPHTAVYKMHRYFARRPWSVFRFLIEHYSNPGSIVLDPFCGGGVTMVEGLRLGRKVIGVDISPLATFVTRMELTNVDLEELQKAFNQIEVQCRERIESLYKTSCPKCEREVAADWFEWSNVYLCPQCHVRNVVSNCKKQSPGLYRCAKCKETFKPLDAEKEQPVLVNVSAKCPSCGNKAIWLAKETDLKNFAEVTALLENWKLEVGSDIPVQPIPDGNMPRENALSRRDITHFKDFFTTRNLFANALLRKFIRETDNQFLWLAFSASLKTTNSLVQRVAGFAGGQPEWSRHAFWPPEVFGEINVWRAFSKCFASVLRGKRESNAAYGDYAVEAAEFAGLNQNATFLVITGSSHTIPVPNSSVDTVITDPPYGGNVQYLEMSNFWLAWLPDGIAGPIQVANKNEAIETRRQGFKWAKNHRHYRDMLLKIFKECYRVLKPDRWMVMTFHNKEFKVWNALHLAAHDAGFRLPEHDGVIYQPPIKLYQSISHTKYSGAMLGDFLLAFQKVGIRPEFKAIEHAEIGWQIERLAAEAVLHHRGASLSLIYMKLMPWLLNNNLLDKISEKELVPYLTNSFEEKDGKWRLKASPSGDLKQALEEYSKQHYKASYEDLDFVPMEARIEYIIKRLLYARGFATQDDILNAIYKNLINSNMAEAREIQQVLSSIATLMPISQAAAGKVPKGKAGRKVWKLKEDIEREKLFAELGADVEYRLNTTEESEHDLAIARLVEMAGLRKLKAHIGRTEQMKYAEFRQMSSDLPQRVKGMPKAARDIIEQIDVLWHNGGKGIVAAFEVERTTTITSGIERFRNLLTAAPESEVELYLVVPKSRGNEVRNKLGSPANRKDGLHKKIGYIYLEDLKIRNAVAAVDFEKIKHFINGGQ